MVRTPLNVSHLELVKRIPERNMTESLSVSTLLAISDDMVLEGDHLCLRAISINSSQLSPHDVVAFRDVSIMAFDAHTDTLLLLVTEIDSEFYKWDLLSLRRNASEWIEVQRLPNVTYNRHRDRKI